MHLPVRVVLPVGMGTREYSSGRLWDQRASLIQMQVCWIYVSEIPAARLRGLNVSIAAATQWLFNLVIARAVPNMLVTM